MNVTLFITLLTTFSTITSLCTSGCKKILDEVKIHYASNVLAFVIACIVGISGTAAYYVISSIEFNAMNIVCMILMGVATSVGAMVGYDKVMQTIGQVKSMTFK